MYKHTIGNQNFTFVDLKDLLAKATPFRTGDALAELAAQSELQRVAAQFALADLPLKTFLTEALIPYEKDEVTRLIIDSHDRAAFAQVSSFTVGQLRDWLLSDIADHEALIKIRGGLTPEMVAAVSKLMRNQDLISVAQKCEVVSKFRTTVGLKNRLSVRIQPNHPTDNWEGILASTIDGLMYGSGDAVIGINPATDSPEMTTYLLQNLAELIDFGQIPTQSCVLCHVTTTLQIINKAPVDLIFQSIAGTEAANKSFGIDLSLLKEANEAGKALKRGTMGNQVMYFETGQGSALSANAHSGVDQQTCEARAYAVARAFDPFLVNSVVGFIGPEYLFDGKQIARAGLEDHFCAKLLGLPMGMDICYTNHAEADQNDQDNLMTLLGLAGCNFIMGVPAGDDIMLNYQSTSFHDALYLRKILGKKPAPEFEDWLIKKEIFDQNGNKLNANAFQKLLK